jgi:DNA-binding response OmpR family regulator
MHVLVVEDDALLRDAIGRALEGALFHSRCVDSAERGSAALREHEFALAIVDIGLPGQNGVEFVKQVRRDGGRFPIIMATARDTTSDRKLALAAGANDYVIKPFLLPELIEKCRALMSPGRVPDRHALTIVGGMVADLDSRHLLEPTLMRTLTAKEWTCLEQLVLHVNRFVSGEKLGTLLHFDAIQVDGTVRALRAVLGTAVTIRMARGLGYQLSAR